MKEQYLPLDKSSSLLLVVSAKAGKRAMMSHVNSRSNVTLLNARWTSAVSFLNQSDACIDLIDVPVVQLLTFVSTLKKLTARIFSRWSVVKESATCFRLFMTRSVFLIYFLERKKNERNCSSTGWPMRQPNRSEG